MKIKICPNCGSHNVATASYCANKGCEKVLSDVNIVEMNDDIVRLVKEPEAIPRKDWKDAPKSTWQILTSSCLTISIIFGCGASFLGFALTAFNNSSEIWTVPLVAIGSGLGALIIAGGIWIIGWLWIWPIIDCLRNEPNIGNTKVMWAVITIMGGWPGGIIYLAVRRSQRIASYGQ
jgi:hypothetical protein